MNITPIDTGCSLTFAFGSLRLIWLAVTSNMDLLDLAEIATVITLRHRAPLFANLEKRSITVIA
jgi:hypothetical protein